ncbi:CDP-glycerol glycerophosphotransferase family protein [Aeromicrobium sp. JJY06]|uniref:CDP-glycerol glycerophosphotransferase family protein n=1 Tax=Aeromicrobium sp. JJY06 TaxID=3373478 RepID=UPI00376F4332
MAPRIPAALRARLARVKRAVTRGDDAAPPIVDAVRVAVDADGRVTLAGTARDGMVVDAVTLQVRGGGAKVKVPASGRAEFAVTADVPDRAPTSSHSIDVQLHLRSAAGKKVTRRLTAGPGDRSAIVSEIGETRERPVWWYATRDGYLSIRVGVQRIPKILTKVTAVRGSAHGFAFEADLITMHADGRNAELEVTVRATEFAHRLPLQVGAGTRDPLSREITHPIAGAIDVTALVAAGMPANEQSVDVAVVVDGDDGTPLRRGLAVPGDLRGFRRLKPLTGSDEGFTQVLVPFLTFKSKNLSFARELFTRDAHRYLTRLRRLGPLWTVIRAFSSVWVVGETPYKAQDAGFHLFRWVRQQHPGRRAYYVITEDSPERANVDPLGNVVTVRSREHIRACFLARRFVTTHNASFVLATSDRRAVRWMRGNRVFLQHGVLGTKNMAETYGRLSPAFHTDFVHVSSPRERELMINDLRYRPQQVRVTGLSRFDRLLEPAEEPPRGILVIPTWRDWLSRPAAFEESEFLERWRAFLTSEPIRQAIAEGLPVTVILHPNMRFFGDALAVEGATVLRQGDVDVQTLLRSHAAMVTDYSSVGFDFSFQGRPVFYHQFDRQRFLGKRPSHLDLDLDLPGDVFREVEPLAEAVVASWRAGFPQDAEHARRSALFLEPATGSYSEQVFESVRTARSAWVPLWRLRDSSYGRRTYRAFRKGRLFQPSMKAIAAVGRMLPRRDLVVLESDTGRAVADSPRAIYEELVRRGAPFRYVWSTRSTFRPLDVTTRKVEPGSPAFHWHLSRARYWVNNQNFGPVVKPAKGTTYLQTWHGTPLKRMQYDAVSTTGRAPGYLERVSAKTATWSMLLSPSPYATEAFRSAFRYEGRVLEVGYPRNDVLARDAKEVGEVTRRRLGLRPEDRVVLYAPTFRDDVKQGKQFVWDGALEWEPLVEGLDEDTVILVRRHSVVRGSLKIPPELAHRVLNVSSYPDMQDLLCVADVLVTDYSSVMFDYAILDRPIVLFCYDLAHYRDDLRGFYLDFEAEAPGPIVATQEELRAALLEAEGHGDAYATRRHEFRQRFAPLDDGHAAERVVDEVFGS